MQCINFTKVLLIILHNFDLFFPQVYSHLKFLVHILKPLTSNEYTQKDPFVFTEENVEQSSMENLDISFHTDLPLKRDIGICTKVI